MTAALAKYFSEIGTGLGIAILVAAVIALHIVVVAIRRVSRRLMTMKTVGRLSKSKTIVSLATSFVIFSLYFAAIGLILNALGISLKAYIASASILGLAIGFGSQGLVQDVVNGLTIVFSGLFNVGDMVDIAGQPGIVRDFGMRFTIIENALGAQVYIPNRTIANVVLYPRGYVRGFADVILPGDPGLARQVEEKVTAAVGAAAEQFPGIFVSPPSLEGRVKTGSGKEFMRAKFRLWPGRGAPIETAFKQELLSALKALDPSYQEWMVTVNYEVERKPVPL